MNAASPKIRRDLEFFPVMHGGQQLIIVRDHLGLVQAGKTLAIPLYRFMTLLDGKRDMRDLQMELIRQRGGIIVGAEEVYELLKHLDDQFLLDSKRFQSARHDVEADFSSKKVRPCSHCGQAYPADPLELQARLDEILNPSLNPLKPKGRIRALIAPHIDLSVGYKVYASTYQMLRFSSPLRIVLLGVGHRMVNHLFSLCDKDFETPLGVLKSDPAAINRLRDKGNRIVADNDFDHRSEHSIEFQAIFLQHILKEKTFRIIPILCGDLQAFLPEYSREAYLESAGLFLKELRSIIMEQEEETIFIAGVDFSHIGPKFGHDMPAHYIQNQSKTHDERLLNHLIQCDADGFWKESRGVDDRFHVCGFAALACLLEVMPSCRGEILNYEIWHEEPTRSAVSFAGVVFHS